jgi:hypothetical protein
LFPKFFFVSYQEKKRFLRRILGILGIPKYVAAEVVYPVLIFAEKLLKGRTVAALKASDQI